MGTVCGKGGGCGVVSTPPGNRWLPVCACPGGRMEQAGDALEEVLSKALSQRSLTLGVYEAAKLLNV